VKVIETIQTLTDTTNAMSKRAVTYMPKNMKHTAMSMLVKRDDEYLRIQTSSNRQTADNKFAVSL
jgi:hypothetical protein